VSSPLPAPKASAIASKDHQGVQLFVPGRLCLFGEHSDWAAEFALHPGCCLVVGTDQGLHAVARVAEGFSVQTLVPDESGHSTGRTRRMDCPWTTAALEHAARDRDEFFRYCAGTAFQMHQRPDVPGGLDLQITGMDLPLRKGVSSSAAVCMLVAKAFDAVHDLRLFPHEMMELAYLGEKMTGSQCGRMDQACIYGKTPVLLTFQKEAHVRVEPLFPQGWMYLFLVDLAGRKDTIRILQCLQEAYPKSQSLQAALGPANEDILRQAYQAVGRADAACLGSLMRQAQENFDRFLAPHCPGELESPLLHQVLAMDGLQPHVWGGKCVGSGGDGTAQFIARSAEDRTAAMEQIVRAFPRMRCFPLNIVPQGNRVEPSES